MADAHRTGNRGLTTSARPPNQATPLPRQVVAGTSHALTTRRAGRTRTFVAKLPFALCS